MKRYIVFLKQVPQSTKVELNPVTKTLKRSSALSRTNPDDLYALQMALDLKRDTAAEVVAVSMGPASAETVLREALQRGADRAILLSSPAFAGSDTWCTSLVLGAAVRKIGAYDLLFFGKMAIDGDTAQVGPEVAGQLDIPQVTCLSVVGAADRTYDKRQPESGGVFAADGNRVALRRDGKPRKRRTGLHYFVGLAPGATAGNPSLGREGPEYKCVFRRAVCFSYAGGIDCRACPEKRNQLVYGCSRIC